jgi:2-iminobutanoate/2-iminopropanoate deaminase
MKTSKRSLEIDGLNHGAMPIPMGARVGNTIFTSAISGRLPATNKLAEGAEAQARQAFANLAALLEKGGADMSAVGLVNVLVADESFRDAVNKAWLAHFPDPEDRPARHTSVQALRNGMLVQLQAIAVIAD